MIANAIETTPIDVVTVLNAIETFINKRPGLDYRDYGELAPYRAELRSIAKDKRRALAALANARRSINPDAALLADSFERAFSGRLSWVPGHGLEYCTGQYFPTEYRKAAASVLEAYDSAMARKWNDEHPATFKFQTMADVKAANQSIGSHWFERSTMRFFNTRIESKLMTRGPSEAAPGGRQVFITSERMDENHAREYTIREAKPDGDIDTLGEFQGYKTLEDAQRAVRLLA
jgi:hypothetical protein